MRKSSTASVAMPNAGRLCSAQKCRTDQVVNNVGLIYDGCWIRSIVAGRPSVDAFGLRQLKPFEEWQLADLGFTRIFLT